jgi:hypothetical protein
MGGLSDEASETLARSAAAMTLKARIASSYSKPARMNNNALNYAESRVEIGMKGLYVSEGRRAG